jgi:adenylate cyclase class 2
MTPLETEVKIYLTDLATIQARLHALGATQSKPRLFERNIRYENVEESLTSNAIVLRLRQDDRVRLTYKEPYTGVQSAGSITRVELETEIGNFEAMHAILQKLGYHPHVNYEKYRTTYQHEGAEIVLDEMPYGHFMEIEGTPQIIEHLVVQLELGDYPRLIHSYMDLFERIKQRLGLSIHDLTFTNFEGIHVPAQLFLALQD